MAGAKDRIGIVEHDLAPASGAISLGDAFERDHSGSYSRRRRARSNANPADKVTPATVTR